MLSALMAVAVVFPQRQPGQVALEVDIMALALMGVQLVPSVAGRLLAV